MKYLRNAFAGIAFAVMLALAAFPFRSQIADAAGSFTTLLGTMNADGTATVAAGTPTGPYGFGSFHLMGAIFTTTSTAATATGTTQQTLATYSLPASSLDVNGRMLRCSAVFSFAANAHTKQVGVAFGSEALDTTVTAMNNNPGPVVLHLYALKTGSSTQIVWGDYELPAGAGLSPAVATYEAAGAETDTNAITINFNALDGTSAASDVVLDHGFCEFMN